MSPYISFGRGRMGKDAEVPESREPPGSERRAFRSLVLALRTANAEASSKAPALQGGRLERESPAVEEGEEALEALAKEF